MEKRCFPCYLSISASFTLRQARRLEDGRMLEETRFYCNNPDAWTRDVHSLVCEANHSNIFVLNYYALSRGESKPP